MAYDGGRRRSGTCRRAALGKTLGHHPLRGEGGKGQKKATETYASSSAAAAAATADGFGHARASKFECGSGTLA